MRNKALLLFLLLTTGINAQIWFSELFDTANFPPENWTIDQHPENWHYVHSNFADGQIGEVSFNGYPPFQNTTTRLISPLIDIADGSNLAFHFKYITKSYINTFTLGVATRHGEEEWTSVWETNGSTTNSKEVDFLLDDESSSSDFQFCFYFTGNADKIKFWAIDDIRLYQKKDHDIEAKSIITTPYFTIGTDYIPVAGVFNNGTTDESFDVTCKIFDIADNQLFSHTQTVSNLAAGDYQEITFDTYHLPLSIDNAYHIVVTTNLSEDMFSPNNTTDKYIYTYTTHHHYVLAEMGTATWCSACPYAVEALDSIINSGHNLALIEYHSNDDYATTNSEIRVTEYYNMYGLPTTIFDGVEGILGAGPNFYSQFAILFNQRSLKRTGTAISLTAEKVEGGYNAHIEITKIAPVFNKHAVLHVVLTESHIPEIWQGETELGYVARKILPDADGIPIDFINNDESIFDIFIETDETWNEEELELVAFIQDNDTHEILNTNKAKMSELTTTNLIQATTKIRLSCAPNPFSNITDINFELRKNSSIDIKIFNFSGKLIANPLSNRLEKGKHHIPWQTGNHLPAGIYFLKLTTDDMVETIKIIKQ